MPPKDYTPDKSYPLVVALHRISKRVYAAEYLATEAFRTRYPAFVLVPIAPKRAFWESPKNKDYTFPRSIPYPDYLPSVIDAINEVSQ